MSKRLGIFYTHPIPYFVPLWRELSRAPGLDVVVHYFSDHSVRGGIDAGFGVPVAWDTPLLDGYEHTFLSRDADLAKPASIRLPQPRQTLPAGKFDAVLFNGYMHGFERQLVQTARSAGAKTIIRADFTDVAPFEGRSALKAQLRDFYLRWFYRKIDAFCYAGHEAKQHLLSHGVPADRLFFSPYSVDATLSPEQTATLTRERARADLGLDSAHTVLLFSGKLIPRKEPLLLIEALSMLGDVGNVGLIILGDGELREKVESRARKLLGPRLIMPGFVNQSRLGAYFSAADLFILPAAFETWGLVVNEAMQFGLPTVVSDRVGCRHDLVEDGVTGHVFRSGDAGSLAAVLRPMMGNRRVLAELGCRARQRVAKYSIQASADGIRRAVGVA
jgi:glycosyltransferase involved in cell wall biosynthesis